MEISYIRAIIVIIVIGYCSAIKLTTATVCFELLKALKQDS